MGSEYAPAIDMFVDESRTFIGALKGNKDLSIVIHGTGSPGDTIPTAQEIALYFASNKDMVSSHFVIGRDGKVVQCVSLNNGAASNCCLEEGYDSYWTKYEAKYQNLNKCTISIEHCNDATNSKPLTKAQQQASFDLIKFLTTKYNIPTSRIKTHASLDPKTRKQCPGNYPMDALIASLKPQPKPTPEPTISEQQVLAELDQVEKELQALRGMITVNKPTVIE